MLEHMFRTQEAVNYLVETLEVGSLPCKTHQTSAFGEKLAPNQQYREEYEWYIRRMNLSLDLRRFHKFIFGLSYRDPSFAHNPTCYTK
jgi:hypothetical protein